MRLAALPIRRLPSRLSAGLLLLAVLVPLAPRAEAQATDPPGALTAFRAAFRAYGERQYERAAEAFGQFALRHPECPETADARFYEAQSVLAQGRGAHAAVLFERFTRQYPLHPFAAVARLGVGRFFFEQGDYVAARAAFERVGQDPASPGEAASVAFLWAAEAALRQPDDAGALALYRQGYTAYPEAPYAPLARYAEAFHLIRLGRQAEAAQALEALDARYPASGFTADLGLALTEVYHALGQYRQLVEATVPRLEALSSTGRERATYLLGDAYLHLGQGAEATARFRTVLADFAGGAYDRPARYGLGHALMAQGQAREAALAFGIARQGTADSLLAADTLARRAAYAEGIAQLQATRPDSALAAFARTYTTWPGTREAAHALFEAGLLHYGRGRFAEAAPLLERFASDAPRDPRAGEALELAANALVGAGDVGGAERLFERAAQRAEATPEARDALSFQRATFLYGAGSYAQAYDRFRTLADNGRPADLRSDALFWAAESAFGARRFADAVTLAQRYLDRYASGRFHDAARYVKAWALLRANRYDDATAAFETFVDEADLEGPARRYRDDAYLRLGDLYAARRRFMEAANAYARVATDGRDYSLFGIGQAYDAAGQDDRAARAWERLLREFPASDWREEAQYSLGYLAFKADRFDEAIQHYTRLVERYAQDPLAAKAQYGIGDAHYNAGRLQQAAEAYARVLERYPASPFAAEAAANLEGLLGETGGRGRDVLDRFTQNAPAEVTEELRYRQAETAFARGDLSAARRALAPLVQSARNATLRLDAQLLLADVAVAEGRTDEAAEGYRRVMNADAYERRAEAARRLGDVLLGANNARTALDAYRRAETLAEGDERLVAAARLGQARALLVLGQPAEAEALVAPLAATDAAAALTLARLQEATGRPAEAAATYRRASADDGVTGAEATFRLGTLLLAQSDAAGALAAVQGAETRFEGFDLWLSQALLVRARALRALNRAPEARAAYLDVETRFPGTEAARLAAAERAP